MNDARQPLHRGPDSYEEILAMIAHADPCEECARNNCVHCAAMFGHNCGCLNCHREGLRRALARLDNVIREIHLHSAYLIKGASE